ncbi:MAG: type I restriction enzyme HsdR N-terminal domain-containing protein [Coriobacteriia bacterium]|nr:type I restriction enzyme HsdR N-terminal domain-containing protein [Coriobacteriia bacterium]
MSTNRTLAAQKFATEWADPARGREIADTQTFWNQFLQEVMGIQRVHHIIDYEKRVRIGRSQKRVDAYIPESRVLIEQKSATNDLSQPDTTTSLTPYEQALNYAAHLPPSEQPKYIITSNFHTFNIYDREADPAGIDPTTIHLDELPQQLATFNFITDPHRHC